MKTTDILQMQEDRRAQAALSNYMEQFTRRWAPHDRRDNAEFQADFLLVVQAVHRDAMKPMEAAMTAAFSSLPPMFLHQPEAKGQKT